MTLELASLRDLLKHADPQKINSVINSLLPEEAEALLYDWPLWARNEQLPPSGEWQNWLILAGRGWGKTRTGAEWIKLRERQGFGRFALVGRTAADVRDVMVEGESGLLSLYPSKSRPKYEKSNRRVVWPSGAIATCYSADTPDQLRGPQHDTAWADELATWQYPDAWDQLMFGLRLGVDPRIVVTTTPRPTAIIKSLVIAKHTVLTKGSTYDNRANLAKAFMENIIAKYEGTRLGRQELNAEILDDNPNALWNRSMIETTRIHKLPSLKRIVVAIDPAVTSEEESDETGIVVAGVDFFGKYYVLEDCSIKGSPHEWASVAVAAYQRHKADRIIAEANNGGDMIEAVIRNVADDVPYSKVHASRGKVTRAEPIAALYEQSRVHHVGFFPALEDQMCEWEPGQKSPDRMDAIVWALTELSTGSTGQFVQVRT